MNQQLLIIISQLVLLLVSVGASVILLIASLYDSMTTRRQKKYTLLSQKLSKRFQPRVLVLVFSKNDAATIIKCLKSVADSHYQNYQLIVVDDNSKDDTKKVVREYIKRFPERNVQLVAKRTPFVLEKALNQFIPKKYDPEFVLCLDANQLLEANLIRNCVVKLREQSSTESLKISTKDLSPVLVDTILRMIRSDSKRVLLKAQALTFAKRRGITLGAIYKKSALVKIKKNDRIRNGYISYSHVSLVGNSRPQVGHMKSSRLIGAGAFGGTLFVLFLMSYWLYVSATLQSNVFLVLSWAIVSVWIVMVIIGDEATSFSKKVSLLFCVPIAYFLVYVDAATYIFASLYRLRLYPRHVFANKTIK